MQRLFPSTPYVPAAFSDPALLRAEHLEMSHVPSFSTTNRARAVPGHREGEAFPLVFHLFELRVGAAQLERPILTSDSHLLDRL